MDYVIFLIGLILLSGAAGASSSIWLSNDSAKRVNGLLLAIGISSLAIHLWTKFARFLTDDVELLNKIDPVLGALFVSTLLLYFLRSGSGNHSRYDGLKWLLSIITGVFIYAASMKGLLQPAFYIPAGIAAFLAGWQIQASVGKSAISRIACGFLFLLVSAVCLMPDLVDVGYNLQGKPLEAHRLHVLCALVAAAVGSVFFSMTVWAAKTSQMQAMLSPELKRRQKIGTTVVLTASLITLTNGAWLAHWLGDQVQQEQTETLLSALKLGSTNFDTNLIAQIRGIPEDTNTQLYQVIQEKLTTLRQALPKTRFAYLSGMRNGKWVYLVDAEPVDSKDFSPPGMVHKDYPEKWHGAIAGNSTFEGPDSDAWGVWFTAMVPIYNKGTPTLSSVLAVDYPAKEWIRPLASRRLASMAITFSIACLLQALYLFHLTSIRNALVMDHLSEQLSDAMDAAGFDTWEWFRKKLRLSSGDKLLTTLGLADENRTLDLRQIWKLIHPEDRYQIHQMLRRPPDAHLPPAEAEIRLRDSQNRWYWFMLRGRILNPSAINNDTRVVGTILNIDESYRIRHEIDRQRRFALHVMESVPNGLAVIDSHGALTYANPAFIRMSNYPQTKIIGTPLDSLLKLSSPPLEERRGQEGLMVRADGNVIPVQAFSAPLSEGGKRNGSILAVIDLTAAKNSERALLQSREEANRLALVAKRTDNSVFITNAQGQIEWVNEGFSRISGYAKEEVLGKIPEIFLANGSTAASVAQKLRTGQGFESEIVNYRKDGRSYLVHVECQPLHDKNGALTGYTVIERDITRTRRSAKLLEAVASVSSTLLSSDLHDAVWGEVLESLGRASHVDQAYIYRVHPSADKRGPLMSQLAEWNSKIPFPRIKNAALQSLPMYELGLNRWRDILSAGHDIYGVTGEMPETERALLQAQGTLSLVVVPIFVGDAFWGFMGFDSCTEERRWESWEVAILRSAAANIGLRMVAQNESDALRLARDEANIAAGIAEKANRAKSTFLATMSHEIRTPLNAVIGMASLMETTQLNAQQRDYAETILRSSHFLLELINDILDYSRIESGKIELESAAFSLPDLCREAFDVVRVSAMGKELELVGSMAPGLPQMMIGDSSRIRQVLVNLLGNAIKFTPRGYVFLGIGGEQQADGKWLISLSVQDSGIGISPDSIDKLFKPFVQEDSSTTRRFGGSGLGLAISKRLTQLMGGDITVSSVQGKGTNITASFRLTPTAAAIPELLPPLLGKSNFRVLIVDDHDLNRTTLENIFRQWNLATTTATSAQNALHAWQNHGPFDLVVIDYTLPDMDSQELVRHLRTQPSADSAKFVLTGPGTGYPESVPKLFNETINKPFWTSAVHSVLGRIFRNQPLKPVASPSEVGTEQLSGMRVLIAEDNINNQKVARLLLNRLGIEPEIVDNGQLAVDAVRMREFDVILMDLQMPVMDGLEASRAIHSLHLPKRPRIIALTANAFQEDKDAAAASGMDGYLSKPITLARLKETLAGLYHSLTRS
ncbi:MAG: response regulator [Luteolibacter sp.]